MLRRGTRERSWLAAVAATVVLAALAPAPAARAADPIVAAAGNIACDPASPSRMLFLSCLGSSTC